MLFPRLQEAQAALAPGWAWPHFSMAELACRCAGRYCAQSYWHDPAFLDGLEQMRALAGDLPLVVHSGHRCPQWNALVGGAPRSRHKQIAADIALYGHDRVALRKAAEDAGFTGLGLARNFLHIDRRPVPAVWTYGDSEKQWQI